jgi:hypothetical protein
MLRILPILAAVEAYVLLVGNGTLVYNVTARRPAPATWQLRRPREGHSVVRVADMLVILGGTHGSAPVQEVSWFGLNTAKWTDKQAPPQMHRSYAAAVAVPNGAGRDRIYVCGGLASGQPTDTLLMYEPLPSNAWSTGPSMPAPAAYIAAATAGGAIYVMGIGLQIWMFDSQWKTVPPSPRPYTALAAMGPRLVAASDTFSTFDTAAREWTFRGQTPSTRANHSMVEEGGIVYVLGGDSSDVWTMDIAFEWRVAGAIGMWTYQQAVAVPT